MLTEVHRQARNDPIVHLSMEVRAGNRLAPGRYGLTAVVSREDFDPQRALETDQILVGRNATRRAYNARMRQRRGLADALPVAGDKLVCLRNNRRKGLFNGSLWLVEERKTSRARTLRLRLKPDETIGARSVKASVRPECFLGGIEAFDWRERKRYDEFDFGYVLTVHKAQGSQWDDVVLFDESFAFPDSRERWLYTGITRAAKRLTVVV
jgi:exodeoxyribonuclease-5